MKQIIYILVVTIIGLGVTSCGDDFLDVNPPNSLSDNTFWRTKEDATLALAGCYNYWESWANITLFDGMSDNGYYPRFGRFINGSITPSDFTAGFWADAHAWSWFEYDTITKYNNFLAKIDNVSMDDATKKRYKAEVRFLRAYDYFNKVMFFGDIPLVKEPVTSDIEMARTPTKEVKQFILNELKEISKDLPVQNEIQSGGHITSGAALALKARLELYMGNYDAAMSDSKAVIDMGVYELYPDYRELFLDEDNREAILSIQYTKDSYSTMYPQFNLPAGDGGWANMSATKDMINAYQTINGLTISKDPSYDPQHPFKNRDPRLSMTLIYPGENWNGRFYNSLDKQIPDGEGGVVENPDYYEKAAAADAGVTIKKYLKPMSVEEMNNYGGDLMVIRLSEIYLTYAEAALETGQNTELGLQYLNKVRTRSGMSAASELTNKIVRYERRIEFAFENLRFFDIKRWDIGAEVLEGPVYGVRKGSVDMETGDVSWGSDYIKLIDRHFIPERNYLLPIPQHEMDANPKMTQNPGY